MDDPAIFGSSQTVDGAVLQRILNRVFRCRHRHKSLPFTPRGEDQCYAVCLDCGQRVESDMQLLQKTLKATSPSEGISKPKKARARRALPSATSRSGPKRVECATNDSPRPLELGWKYDLLWVGLFAVGLSGGLYFSSQILHRGNRHTSASPAQPSLASVPARPLAGEQGAGAGLLSSPDAADRSSPVIPAVADGPKSAVTHARARAESAAAVNIAGTNQTSHLGGKSSVMIVGLEAEAVAELSQHPGRLAELIQSGALFTVPRGTAMELREMRDGVIKILILEGPMAGREGWAQASQLRRRWLSGQLRRPEMPGRTER